MTMRAGKYEFEGPYRNAYYLRSDSGVILILGNTFEHEHCWTVLDIDSGDDVQHHISNHGRWQCWREQEEVSQIALAVFYCDAANREEIEHDLRKVYRPPCGKC